MASRFRDFFRWVTISLKPASSFPYQRLMIALALWCTSVSVLRTLLMSATNNRNKPQPLSKNLMTLPPEIRRIVLANLFVSETAVKPYRTAIPLWPKNLRVCKQLNVEGTDLLYANNHLLLDEPRRAVRFFAWQHRVSRSMIRNLTIMFAPNGIRLHRNDHPVQDHVNLGHQMTYRNLRELASSIHEWSMALSNISTGVQSITIFPHSFFDCCNHVQHGWMLTSTWFCPGCGLQQFCKQARRFSAIFSKPPYLLGAGAANGNSISPKLQSKSEPTATGTASNACIWSSKWACHSDRQCVTF